MPLTPVEGNPFEPQQEVGLTPVEGNPFEAKLTPVEGNPFGAPEGPRKATFGEAFMRATRSAGAGLGGTLEAVGEATGIEALRSTGEQIRKEETAAAQRYPPPQETLKVQNLSDIVQWAKESTAELIPQMGPGLAGGAAGAVAGGAVGGPIGAVVGGGIGAFIPNYALNTGEVQSKIKEKGGESASAPGVVLGAGVAISALDSIIPFRLGSKLVGKFGAEAAEKIAEQTLLKRIGKEGAKSAGIEGITEALQEAMGEVAASGALDKAPDWAGLGPQMIEAGAKGAFMGGLTGGGTAVLAPQKASSAPPTQEQIQQAFDLTQGPPPASVGVEEAVTPTSETDEQASAVVPPSMFYSTVRRVAEEKLPESASAEQMLATLRNQQGVKEEELQALGLPEWLGSQKGAVSKADLISEIEANAISVQDVVHQESAVPNLRWTENTHEGTPRYWRTNQAPGWQITEERITPIPASGRLTRYTIFDPGGRSLGDFGNLEAAQGLVERHLRGPSTTQYRDYTLPGGENYRELLLTLPATTPEGKLAAAVSGISRGKRDAEDVFVSSHFDEPNIVAHTRLTERTDAEGRRMLFVEEVQSDWHQAGRKLGYKPKRGLSWTAKQIRSGPGQFANVWEVRDPNGRVHDASGIRSAQEAIAQVVRNTKFIPDAPFKTSWPELVVKRLLRLAAAEGIERIAFINGDEQVRRYGLGSSAAQGQREFYDKILPRVVEKWAKRLGAKTGTVEIPTPSHAFRPSTTAFYVEITPAMATRIQQGLPLFSRLTPGRTTVDDASLNEQNSKTADGKTDLRPAVQQIAVVLDKLLKAMRINKAIALRFTNQNALGYAREILNENKTGVKAYEIQVNLARHANVPALYATVMHEFGHILMAERFHNADAKIQLGIVQAYTLFRQRAANLEKFNDLLRVRDNFITLFFKMRGPGESKLVEMTPERRQYWLGFDEWFAEQVARWATTDAKPLNFVDRFFKALGRQLRDVYVAFKKKFGIAAETNQFVADWLNSLVEEPAISYFDVVAAMDERTRLAAQAAHRRQGEEHYPAEGQGVGTSFPRRVLERLDLMALDEAKVAASSADRFNRFYQYMLSLLQVADRNLHIRPLQRYRELWQIKQLERAKIMDEALTTLKHWKRLGEVQSDRLVALLDDYMNMAFLPKEELARGVSRRPNTAEFNALVRKHKVSAEGLAVFQRIVADFDRMLDRYAEILKAEANRVVDPVRQAEALTSIDAQLARLRKAPYFPAMRFGNYTLTLRDAAGRVVHFETFETARKRDAAARTLRPRLAPGTTLQSGFLSKDARPLIGMPSGLLDAIGSKLDLSPTQRQALDQLRFELAPAQSFRHRFQNKARVAGYNQDFQRAYANYFFHGANYFTNVKFVDAMRDQVALVRQSARDMLDSTKRGQIANFMSEHLSYMMDPKPDFAGLRGAIFLWALGFVPAAATLNLTQMIVGSTPFLSDKFGDHRAIPAMLNAGRKLSSYYRKGSLEAAGLTDRDMRAISEGVKQGVITEALAPELAAISDGRNLGKGFGGNAATRGWSHLMESAAWMFQMTEQMNRRITFRAAWQLASDHPEAKYVEASVQKHNLEYQRLRESGWTERDAAAFVTAKDVVESTQFVYQKYAQPRFMRGRAGAIFVFKSFVQNTLFMLWNHPATAVRSLLIMGFLGGLMGLPGTEDLRGILKALAWQLLGKDFDIEDEARKFVLDILKGEIPPDIMLHGISRRGFGIPSIMDGLGVHLPVIDRSKAIGLGRILPIDVGQLLGPGASRDQNRALAQQTQQASGAAFGTFFNIYKALTDGQLDVNDLKRWEKAVPRAVGNVSKMYRSYEEGGERTRTGNMVVRYDANDPRQMAEIIGLGMGYQPLRLSAKWDLLNAEREAKAFWDIRREMLLRQLWSTRQGGSGEEYQRVLKTVREFNKVLPPEVRPKAITAEVIQRSFQTRVQDKARSEIGLPRQNTDIPLMRSIQRLYPEAEVNIRKVK